MSHSVLVETARRFVGTFYQALAEGKRVGDAMLAGQRRLKEDTFRGQIFGAGELRLEDWFVPVLFQEKDDPQLFKTTPARQTVEDFQNALAARLGDLPPVPETGFIGRSRELLALERLLREPTALAGASPPVRRTGRLAPFRQNRKLIPNLSLGRCCHRTRLRRIKPREQADVYAVNSLGS